MAARVTARAFARAMAALGPFEDRPRVAVAVSGGADSMALALLLHDWARARGGEAVALTVDHGLRAAAAAEARQVGRWLRARGVTHRVLRWRGTKPASNVQARARTARYALLEAWCARHGVLHLATAHNLEDQAETFLLRLGRGSGLDGLAAMAPVVERVQMRLIRPLLDVPRARIEATLRAAGQAWVEDPTNRDPAHARVRLRALAPALAAEGLTAERLVATARHLGRARAALDAGLAALLAEAVSVEASGAVVLDRRRLAQAPEEVGLRALARVAQYAGGADYAPRLEALLRLRKAMAVPGFRGATLAGCLWRPAGGGCVRVVPEPSAPHLGRRRASRSSWRGEPLLGASFAVV